MEHFELGAALTAIDPALLHDERLRTLLAACQAHPDIDVLELRHVPGDPGYDLIVVEAGDGTVAPRNTAGIRRRERLALLYQEQSGIPFQVLALRRDFPETLHQNGVEAGTPKSLCLYELDWDTVERSWTAPKLLAQILRWLEKTADGTLHEPDQALEQVFYGSGHQLVLPTNFIAAIAEPGHELRLRQAFASPQRMVLVGAVDRADAPTSGAPPFQVLSVALTGVEHPPIQAPPATLGELQARLEHAGSSLLPALTDVIRVGAHAGAAPGKIGARKQLMLLLRIPRLRNGECVRVDVTGFLLLDQDLASLGLALGVLQQTVPDGLAFPFHVMGAPDAGAIDAAGAWQPIKLLPLDLRHSTTRASARYWSGVAEAGSEFRGVLAGVGALGSALADLWARAGWGRWDYVDPDLIEPHNVIRHLARHGDVGRPKVDAVREQAAVTLGEACADTSTLIMKANARDEPTLETALKQAALMVDATTTLSVPRDWSDRDDLPRTATVFLAPSGQSSVLLLEDATRNVRIASLEAQYYRAILRTPWGADHLTTRSMLRRTGAGCRDRSLVMAAEQIQLHAAILARRLRLQVGDENASISVWSCDDSSGAVDYHKVLVHPVHYVQHGEWTVYWDEGLEDQLREMRACALPNETGGILLGVTDHKLHTIHLVDALAAPLDSDASPQGFTRGKQGVEEARQDCVARTAGMVDYVGEWHSHPRGVAAAPSGLDVVLLAHLAAVLAADGVPGVMLIVGEQDLSVSLGTGVYG